MSADGRDGALPEFEVASVADFVSLVSSLHGNDWIYRGQADASWTLAAPVDREPLLRHSQRIPRDVLERDMLDRFKRDAGHLLASRPTSELEWLVLAQHHGLPTRLLHWSDNALVALYFAVEAVHLSGPGRVLAYLDFDQLEPHEDPFDVDSVKIVDPPQRTPRMAAQSSRFTVHPSAPHPAGTGGDAGWPGRLLDIRIPGAARRAVAERLGALGVHRAALFPEPDGIAAHIRATTPRFPSLD